MWNPFKPRAKRTTIEAILDDSEDMDTKQIRVNALIDQLGVDLRRHNADANNSILLCDRARLERARVCRLAGVFERDGLA